MLKDDVIGIALGGSGFSTILLIQIWKYYKTKFDGKKNHACTQCLPIETRSVFTETIAPQTLNKKIQTSLSEWVDWRIQKIAPLVCKNDQEGKTIQTGIIRYIPAKLSAEQRQRTTVCSKDRRANRSKGNEKLPRPAPKKTEYTERNWLNGRESCRRKQSEMRPNRNVDKSTLSRSIQHTYFILPKEEHRILGKQCRIIRHLRMRFGVYVSVKYDSFEETVVLCLILQGAPLNVLQTRLVMEREFADILLPINRLKRT